MIQLPSSGGLNFEASDQLDQSSFYFSLLQLILSKFLSNFKVSVIRESRTTQSFDSIWCSLHKSFRCSLYFWQLILSVQLDRSGTLYFGAAYIFGNLFFRREYSINQEFWQGLEEGVFEVGEWDQYIAYTNCVLSTSIVVCEHVFSKQNWVKSEMRTCLNLDTLAALMRVSLNSLGVEFIDWNGIFDTWKTATVTNKRRALSLQEMKLDGWFFIISLY
jgi:hypothetical protein